MSDGFRITESGDYRITQASVFRITEKFYEGFSAVSGSSSLSATGRVLYLGSSASSASGSLSASGVVKVYAAALVANNSTLEATPIVKRFGSASLVSDSSTMTVGTDYYVAYAQLTASSSLTENHVSIKYGQIDSVVQAYERTTEAGDTRVTESGLDTRVTSDLESNMIVGSLVANGTVIPFTSKPYIKLNGAWKQFTPYAKHNGSWQLPNRIYRKINGVWKRIY